MLSYSLDFANVFSTTRKKKSHWRHQSKASAFHLYKYTSFEIQFISSPRKHLFHNKNSLTPITSYRFNQRMKIILHYPISTNKNKQMSLDLYKPRPTTTYWIKLSPKANTFPLIKNKNWMLLFINRHTKNTNSETCHAYISNVFLIRLVQLP